MYGNAIRLLAKERYADYMKAGRPPINSDKWTKQIKFEYDAKDWEWNSYAGAWRQYRTYESIWREKNPGKKDRWESPTKKDGKKQYRELNKALILRQKEKYRATHKPIIKKYAQEYRLKKRLSHPLSDK